MLPPPAESRTRIGRYWTLYDDSVSALQRHAPPTHNRRRAEQALISPETKMSIFVSIFFSRTVPFSPREKIWKQIYVPSRGYVCGSHPSTVLEYCTVDCKYLCVCVILCVCVVSVCVVVKAAALVGMPRLIFFAFSVTRKFGVR